MYAKNKGNNETQKFIENLENYLLTKISPQNTESASDTVERNMKIFKHEFLVDIAQNIL